MCLLCASFYNALMAEIHLGRILYSSFFCPAKFLRGVVLFPCTFILWRKWIISSFILWSFIFTEHLKATTEFTDKLNAMSQTKCTHLICRKGKRGGLRVPKCFPRPYLFTSRYLPEPYGILRYSYSIYRQNGR